MAGKNGPQLDEEIIRQLAVPYEQYRMRHEALLREITTCALSSPIYADRIRPVSTLEELGELPLTSYEHILECTEREGVDKVLLASVEQAFHTSGSTGKPKRFYYGKEDVQRIVMSMPWCPASSVSILGRRPEPGRAPARYLATFDRRSSWT